MQPITPSTRKPAAAATRTRKAGKVARDARPNYSKNDKVTLCSHVSTIPAYDGKPFVGRDTVLSVSHLTGRGTKRDPWRVVLTDGFHFWHMDPVDIQRAEV